MLLLILALSLFLHIADPINDGYGNSSLTPPSSIYYRSVNAIDITDFSLSKGSKLGFSISFSDLSNPNKLKNGFSLPIVEVYFDDNSKGAKTNAILAGSGMRLNDGENWHYAFKFSGDFIRLYENTESGIVDISKLQQLDISRDGNTIFVSTDLPKKRNLKAYVLAGNYSAFSNTGWKEITKRLSPWSYSSTSQTRPVVDLMAENSKLQKEAIDSGILPLVSSRASSQTLWRTIMLLGLLLAILGLIANILAGKKPTTSPQSKKLADRVRASTLISESGLVESELDENEFFSKLDIDINEYEKNMVIDKTSETDIDFDLEQFDEKDFGSLQTDADDAFEIDISTKADRPKQATIFPDFERPGQTSIKPKKNKKINVHNFYDEIDIDSKEIASKEKETPDPNKGIEKENAIKTSEGKKSLRVVETSSDDRAGTKKETTENLADKNEADGDEIVFSLGDSFWEDFDKTRNINWKK